MRAVDLRKNFSRMEAEGREGFRKQLEVCTYILHVRVSGIVFPSVSV